MNTKNPLVVLLSDFEDDYYHGVMKGVIRSICNTAEFIDLKISNKFDIISTAWVLLNSYKYFPIHTIFLIVVDPGVGSSRKPVIMESKKRYFVGPDNGILEPLITGTSKLYEITIRDGESSTFHGRDIFAPTAGKLALQLTQGSVDFTQVGKILSSTLEKLPIDLSSSTERGYIVYIDTFGNIITNLKRPDHMVANKITLTMKKQEIEVEYFNHFAAGPKDELFVIEGSCETVEIVMKESSAAEVIDVRIGMEIQLT